MKGINNIQIILLEIVKVKLYNYKLINDRKTNNLLRLRLVQDHKIVLFFNEYHFCMIVII